MCIRVVAKENKNDHTFIEFGIMTKIDNSTNMWKIYEFIYNYKVPIQELKLEKLFYLI